MALYTDRASHFITTCRGGLHREVDVEKEEHRLRWPSKSFVLPMLLQTPLKPRGELSSSSRTGSLRRHGSGE